MEQKLGELKRSASELALQEVIKKTTTNSIAPETTVEANANEEKFDEIWIQRNNTYSSEIDGFFNDVCSADLSFAFKTLDVLNCFSSCGGPTESFLWSQNVTSKQSSVTTPMDAHSSICMGSPAWPDNPKERDNKKRMTTSGSSRKQSGDEDAEIEAGPCEQSTNPLHLRRVRRMVLNRESARRSRTRRQAHLADLEVQVKRLSGENVSLGKQLSDASQQCRCADTNNRVLKSDVEALRAKVKLVEDMVARGSLTLNSLDQNNLNSLQVNDHNLGWFANVSPTISIRADDYSYSGISFSGKNSGLGLGNAGHLNNGNINSGVMSDAVSCVSDIRP